MEQPENADGRKMMMASLLVLGITILTIVDSHDTTTLKLPTDLTMYGALKGGTYEVTERQLMRENLRSGMLAVDLGAHVGYHTVLMSRCVGTTGRVIALEPSSTNFDCLVQNLHANRCINVWPMKMAVGDKLCTMSLQLDAQNSGAHALVSQVEMESETVLVTPLDALIGGQHVDLIKCDIQGAEAMFLAGAMQTLHESQPMLLLEYWPYGIRQLGGDPNTVLKTLQELDYQIVWPNDALKRIEAIGDSQGYLNMFLQKKKSARPPGHRDRAEYELLQDDTEKADPRRSSRSTVPAGKMKHQERG